MNGFNYPDDDTTDFDSEKNRKRPGKEPSLPDEMLSAEDLYRRNNRRRRNREAAKRVRERRVAKIENLEEQINTLKREHKTLTSENDALKQKLIKLSNLKHNAAKTSNSEIKHLHMNTRRVSNTEIDVPIIPKIEQNDVFESESLPLTLDLKANTSSMTTSADSYKGHVVWTPGGTFVMTPMKNVKFEYPEQNSQTKSYTSL